VLQPSLLGTIAMEIAGEQSPNDFSFSVKTQTKSAFEILVLAIPRRVGRLCFRAVSSATENGFVGLLGVSGRGAVRTRRFTPGGGFSLPKRSSPARMVKVRRRTGRCQALPRCNLLPWQDHNVEITTKYRNDRLTPMFLPYVHMEDRKCRNLVLQARQPCHSR
jgi:hypothetical protein